MGRRTRWARAGIAAGSLAAVQAIIIFANASMRTDRAHSIAMAVALSWTIFMTVTMVAWHTRPDGTRDTRLPMAAIVLSALASISLISNAPEAVLARVGRPTPATVVAEDTDPLGGSGAHHYTVHNAAGTRIPGEIRDSYDSYDVGSQVVVLTDPRGKVSTDAIPLASSNRWRSVTQAFSLLALILTTAAMIFLFFMGYAAPRTARGR